MADFKLCSVPDCGKRVHGRGFCQNHYDRYRLHGDPLAAGWTLRGEATAFIDTALAYEGDECLLWPFATVNGYGRIRRCGRAYLTHRLVCEEVNGPPPAPQYEAAHRCGNALCVTPNHLRWATPKENHADKLEHGTLLRGVNVVGSKLTEEQVYDIRSLNGGMSQREIAKRFGIAQGTVSDIRLRKSWAWLE